MLTFLGVVVKHRALEKVQMAFALNLFVKAGIVIALLAITMDKTRTNFVEKFIRYSLFVERPLLLQLNIE